MYSSYLRSGLALGRQLWRPSRPRRVDFNTDKSSSAVTGVASSSGMPIAAAAAIDFDATGLVLAGAAGIGAAVTFLDADNEPLSFSGGDAPVAMSAAAPKQPRDASPPRPVNFAYSPSVHDVASADSFSAFRFDRLLVEDAPLAHGRTRLSVPSSAASPESSMSPGASGSQTSSALLALPVFAAIAASSASSDDDGDTLASLEMEENFQLVIPRRRLHRDPLPAADHLGEPTASHSGGAPEESAGEKKAPVSSPALVPVEPSRDSRRRPGGVTEGGSVNKYEASKAVTTSNGHDGAASKPQSHNGGRRAPPLPGRQLRSYPGSSAEAAQLGNASSSEQEQRASAAISSRHPAAPRHAAAAAAAADGTAAALHTQRAADSPRAGGRAGSLRASERRLPATTSPARTSYAVPTSHAADRTAQREHTSAAAAATECAPLSPSLTNTVDGTPVATARSHPRPAVAGTAAVKGHVVVVSAPSTALAAPSAKPLNPAAAPFAPTHTHGFPRASVALVAPAMDEPPIAPDGGAHGYEAAVQQCGSSSASSPVTASHERDDSTASEPIDSVASGTEEEEEETVAASDVVDGGEGSDSSAAASSSVEEHSTDGYVEQEASRQATDALSNSSAGELIGQRPSPSPAQYPDGNVVTPTMVAAAQFAQQHTHMFAAQTMNPAAAWMMAGSQSPYLSGSQLPYFWMYPQAAFVVAAAAAAAVAAVPSPPAIADSSQPPSDSDTQGSFDSHAGTAPHSIE